MIADRGPGCRQLSLRQINVITARGSAGADSRPRSPSRQMAPKRSAGLAVPVISVVSGTFRQHGALRTDGSKSRSRKLCRVDTLFNRGEEAIAQQVLYDGAFSIKSGRGIIGDRLEVNAEERP